MQRRAFVTSGLTLSAGLAAGLTLPISLTGCSTDSRKPGPLQQLPFNAWLTVGSDDSISFLVDRSEMGQGVFTALPMLIAEELGVDLARIKLDFAPADARFTNDLLGGQVTGGSTSIRDAWTKLRTAGARAREMLVAAACAEWGIPTSDCRIENGVIVSSHGKRLRYGEVAAAAAKLPVPEKPALKARTAFTLLGREHPRLDTPSKVDGSVRYGVDVRLPGMLFAALAQSPVLGGKAAKVDDAAARGMPGVRAVVPTSSGIAVVADSSWQALRAREALEIEWEAGPNARLDDGAIRAGLRRAAATGTAQSVRADGDAAATIAAAARAGGRVVRADYELPLLAHATLEPQNCTADVRAEGCDLYAPTQVQGIAQATAASAAGLDPAQVRVHTTFLGGGFGRRLEVDFIPAAVEASKAVGKPVQVFWTREDDMRHDAYRPPAYDQASAAFDADGKLVAWQLKLVGPSITARMFPSVTEQMVDPFAVEAAVNYPYDVPNVRVDYVRHEIGIDVGYWRSVSHALNCFVAESFMDELAAAARQSAAEFRLGLLGKQPRYAAVLKAVVADSRFGSAPAGRFHGLALMEGYGTYMAQVAEVSIEGGAPRVHQIWCASDCGQMVNPAIVRSQIESSIVFGLSAALWGEINLQGGRVQQGNFNDYRILRLHEVPRLHVNLIDSGEAPGGIGEPATALVAPAVCNALYAATGKRLRSLPIARHRFT
jgi:isoquinoline 1-oxidoreductase beta subunit